MPQSEPSLTKRVIQGAGWMVGMRMAMRMLGIVNIAILVRLLSPEDFGLVAMAVIVVGLAEVFAATGIDQALLRHPGPDRDDYATAWTIRLIIASVVGLSIAAGSGFISQFYEDPRVKPILVALACLPFIRALENIWVVEFRRNLAFHKDFQQQVFARFLGTVIGIVLAFVLRSYWALVYAALARAVMLTAVSYMMHSGRPHLSLSRLDVYLGFSGWSILRALSNLLSRMADRLAIGSSAGAEVMGSYTVAGDLARLAGTEIAGPLTRVIQPGYAKIQNQPERLASAYAVTFGLAVYLATSICFGLSATSANFVPIVLGHKWLNSIPILEVFSFAAAGALVTNTTFPSLLIMIGRHKEVTIFRACIAALLVGTLFSVSIHHGVLGVAWTMVASNAISVVIGTVVVRIYLVETGWTPVSLLLRGLLSGFTMYFCIHYFSGTEFVSSLLDWQQLILQILLGGIVYVVTLFLTWQLFGRPIGPEKFLLGYLYRFLSFNK